MKAILSGGELDGHEMNIHEPFNIFYLPIKSADTRLATDGMPIGPSYKQVEFKLKEVKDGKAYYEMVK